MIAVKSVTEPNMPRLDTVKVPPCKETKNEIQKHNFFEIALLDHHSLPGIHEAEAFHPLHAPQAPVFPMK